MIIYSNTLKKFGDDVLLGRISEAILEEFAKHHLINNNENEHRSWDNSLRVLKDVLGYDSGINQEVKVAIEYKIPLTSKRVDFLISGKDEYNKSNIIIIELKQWENCEITDKEDVVVTYLLNSNRAVTHPSYQAYSYAKAIEAFNEDVRKQNIRLYPCAFCHNFKERNRPNIDNDFYSEAISLAPLFLKEDALKLRDFVKKYIKKPDDGSILYTIDNGAIRPSKALQDAVELLLLGNEEFTMIDEQKVAYSSIKKIVNFNIKSGEKHTVIVQGGPGTGKSVIAINLLSILLKSNLNVQYVSKNSAPRNVFATKLIGKNFSKRYVENLFKGSGSYYDAKENLFDCLLVDEAHRLNKKSGLFNNLGQNQIKEIIHASKISVFFIDEDQIVTTKDFGTIDEIKKAAKEENSIIHQGNDFILQSQFRCNGSDGYLAFLDNLLNIRETANYNLKDIDLDYVLKVFDDPNDMREELRELNSVNNKTRMLAGYCYDWISKRNSKEYDIHLINDFNAQWNFANTSTWAIDKNSFDQIGCIHTAQGLEFDYVGVIIGKDLIYRNGRVETDYTKRARTDTSLKGIKTTHNYSLADRIIRNTYKTLLSRGQKGCFIYCEDKNLANYIKNLVNE